MSYGLPSWLDDDEQRVMRKAARLGYEWDFGEDPESAQVATGVRCRTGTYPHEDNIYLDRKNPVKSYAGRYALGEGIRGLELFDGGVTDPKLFTQGSIADVVEAVLCWGRKEGSDGHDCDE